MLKHTHTCISLSFSCPHLSLCPPPPLSHILYLLFPPPSLLPPHSLSKELKHSGGTFHMGWGWRLQKSRWQKAIINKWVFRLDLNSRRVEEFLDWMAVHNHSVWNFSHKQKIDRWEEVTGLGKETQTEWREGETRFAKKKCWTRTSRRCSVAVSAKN